MHSKIIIAFVALAGLLAASPAEARRHQHHYSHRAPVQRMAAVQSGCVETVMVPCYGQQTPQVRRSRLSGTKQIIGETIERPVRVVRQVVERVASAVSESLPHPAGCPARLFCGCGTAAEFGLHDRSLWLAASWLKYPHVSPQSGVAAVSPGAHHVLKVEANVGGMNYVVIDHNGGGNRSWRHVRNLSGYTFVNPS